MKLANKAPNCGARCGPNSTERGPNIFGFATKELSQDAFVAWLAKWADPSYRKADTRMHEAGKLFLGHLFRCHGVALPEVINSVEVCLQWKAIDILIKINGEFVLLIEDKTSSSEHSNQLARYLEICGRAFPHPWKILPLYLKTGDQGSSRVLRNPPSDVAQWYKSFYRKNFLKYLEEVAHLGRHNPLFADFKSHLEAWEGRVSEWRTKDDHREWRWSQWVGFYQELRQELPEWEGHGEWHYQSNPQGGFLLFGLSRETWREGSPQLALRIASTWAKYVDDKLVVPARSRIEFVVRERNKDTAQRRRTRKQCAELLQEIARRNRARVEVPRSRAGQWMRFGEFDYLDDEKPAMDSVLKQIQRCQELMEQFHRDLLASSNS